MEGTCNLATPNGMGRSVWPTPMPRDYVMPNHFPAASTCFYDVSKLPTNGRARWGSFVVDSIHRRSKSRGAELECQTGQGCFWIGRCSSGGDQGKLPPHCNDALVHVHLGLGGRRTRLRQAWEVLRPRVSSSRLGVE